MKKVFGLRKSCNIMILLNIYNNTSLDSKMMEDWIRLKPSTSTSIGMA